MKFNMYSDGGSRGNPGPAAIGVFICSGEGNSLIEHAETIGEATNNVAEYRALLEGMGCAIKLACNLGKQPEEIDLHCHLDSELVVKQVKGEYRLRNYNLQKLWDEVHREERRFHHVSYTHVSREQANMRRADQLVNHALDEAERKARRS